MDCLNFGDELLKPLVARLAIIDSKDIVHHETAGNYVVNLGDMENEAVVFALYFLEQYKCPHQVAIYLAKKLVEELMSSLKEENSEDESPCLTASTLQIVVLDRLHKLCHQLINNPDLDLKSAVSLDKSFRSTSVCAIKNKRRKMEDRCVVIHDLNALYDLKSDSDHSYYAVFDGHGGIEAASYTAAHLHVNMIKHPEFFTNTVLAIKEAYSATDEQFCRRASEEGLKSGCTVVSVLIRDNTLYLSWVGDSQALLVKDGKPVVLMAPHTPDREDEKARIEGLGGFVCFVGTWRVNGTIAVSRALGDRDFKPYVSSEPEVREIHLDGSEDFLVLGCDGLWDDLTNEELAATLSEAVCDISNDYACNNAAEKLVSKAKEQGSDDNITSIVVFLKKNVPFSLTEFKNSLNEASTLQIGELAKDDSSPENLSSSSELPPEVCDGAPRVPTELPIFSNINSSMKQGSAAAMPPEATVLSELPTPPIDDILSKVYSYGELKTQTNASTNGEEQVFGCIGKENSDDNSSVVKNVPNEALQVASNVVMSVVESAIEQISSIEISSQDSVHKSSETIHEMLIENTSFAHEIDSCRSCIVENVADNVYTNEGKKLNASTEQVVCDEHVDIKTTNKSEVCSVVQESSTIAYTAPLLVENSSGDVYTSIGEKIPLDVSAEQVVLDEHVGIEAPKDLEMISVIDTKESSAVSCTTIPLGENVSAGDVYMIEDEKISINDFAEQVVLDEHVDIEAPKDLEIFSVIDEKLDIPYTTPSTDENSNSQPVILDTGNGVGVIDPNFQTNSPPECLSTNHDPKMFAENFHLTDSGIETKSNVSVNFSENHSQDSPLKVSSGCDELSLASIDLTSVPVFIPEAEGVEDNDSDSEKDGGWSYIKATDNVVSDQGVADLGNSSPVKDNLKSLPKEKSSTSKLTSSARSSVKSNTLPSSAKQTSAKSIVPKSRILFPSKTKQVAMKDFKESGTVPIKTAPVFSAKPKSSPKFPKIEKNSTLKENAKQSSGEKTSEMKVPKPVRSVPLPRQPAKLPSQQNASGNNPSRTIKTPSVATKSQVKSQVTKGSSLRATTKNVSVASNDASAVAKEEKDVCSKPSPLKRMPVPPPKNKVIGSSTRTHTVTKSKNCVATPQDVKKPVTQSLVRSTANSVSRTTFLKSNAEKAVEGTKTPKTGLKKTFGERSNNCVASLSRKPVAKNVPQGASSRPKISSTPNSAKPTSQQKNTTPSLQTSEPPSDAV